MFLLTSYYHRTHYVSIFHSFNLTLLKVLVELGSYALIMSFPPLLYSQKISTPETAISTLEEQRVAIKTNMDILKEVVETRQRYISTLQNAINQQTQCINDALNSINYLHNIQVCLDHAIHSLIQPQNDNTNQYLSMHNFVTTHAPVLPSHQAFSNQYNPTQFATTATLPGPMYIQQPLIQPLPPTAILQRHASVPNVQSCPPNAILPTNAMFPPTAMLHNVQSFMVSKIAAKWQVLLILRSRLRFASFSES